MATCVGVPQIEFPKEIGPNSQRKQASNRPRPQDTMYTLSTPPTSLYAYTYYAATATVSQTNHYYSGWSDHYSRNDRVLAY